MAGMMIWTMLLLLVAVLWASRHSNITRSRREQPALTSTTFTGPPNDPPLLSVLIAAKDEEANIETAVRTMLAQDYPNFELIVINDRSDDRTGEILDRLVEEDSTNRLRVVHVTSLRDGWFGKNNAMREGVEVAKGDWLCFGDADCRQTSTATLSSAVRFALERKIDLLSVLPKLENVTVWERIIQPVCGSVMLLWFNPRDVNNPKHESAYANGAFMLMTRGCYQAIGGHERVRTEVNEDMHMARITKESGLRLHVVDNEDLYTVRMYTTLSAIWRGWSRIFYGCFGTFRRLRRTMIMLTVANVFPYASFLIAMSVLVSRGFVEAGVAWQLVGAAAAIAIISQQAVVVRLYRVIRVNPWWAPTFVVGAVICIGMVASAMLKLKGRATTTWRGTTYRADKVAQA